MVWYIHRYIQFVSHSVFYMYLVANSAYIQQNIHFSQVTAHPIPENVATFTGLWALTPSGDDGVSYPGLSETRSALGLYPAGSSHFILSSPFPNQSVRAYVTSMTTQVGITRRQTTALGRSGPRSKTGCQTCKIRRVRCDERRPVCTNCDRLKLDCVFVPPRQRQSRRRQPAEGEAINHGDTTISSEEHGNTTGSVSITSQDVTTPDMQTADTPPGQSFASLSQLQDDVSGNQQSGLTQSPPQDVSIAMNGAQSRPDVLEAQGDSTLQGNGQFLLDSVSCMASDTTTLNEAAAVMGDFAQGGQDKVSWLTAPFNDYSALPDPTFPFTSMAFIESLDPVSSADVPSWRGTGVSDINMFAPDTTALPVANRGGSDLATPMGSSGSAQGASPFNGRPSFTVSPPLLSPSQEESLLAFFERDIRPPASLVGVDPVGWSKIRRHVLRMVKDRHESVLHSVYALSTLLSASSTTIRLGINRDDHILFASRLQEAACAAMHVGVSHTDWESRHSQALLVSVFLLAWFEVSGLNKFRGYQLTYCL